ncbi:MAG: radical SAM protein [Rhodospirillales bacterium]|nr:radical SAM protein [Rhodospirillales bacterium]
MTASPFQPIYDICNAGHSKEKLAKLPAFPRLIDVEMTNTCNFRCLMCPTGNFSQKRAKGFMDDAVFHKVLDEIRPRKTPLRFIRWGEPFTHPRILDYLRACREAGVLTHVNTNGSKLDEATIDALLEIPLDSLKFSFQGVDRKSYAEMRNTDFFVELVATIRRLHAKRGTRAKPFIQVSTTITYESKGMVEAFRRDLAPFCDSLNVGRTVLEYVDLNAVRLRPHEFEELRRLKELESVIKVHPECPEVFDKLSVNWDGTITACCMDSDNVMTIGDVRTQTLAEVWASDTLNRYRSLLAEMRHDELALCKSCYDTHGLSVPGLQDT